MIVYDLMCDDNHRFEGWFKDAAELERQQKTGLLECPVCGTAQVRKIPSPSRINLTSTASSESPELSALKAEAQHIATKIHDYVAKNYEDVGDKFAHEALRIHYGEADQRNIRGTATKQEITTLNDEGIDAFQLPVKADDKNKLN